MRDVQLMTKLLRQMSETHDGCIPIAKTLGMSEEKRKTAHQVELLCDMGLAERTSDSVFRITADGYNFLEENENGDEGAGSAKWKRS